MQGAFLPKWGLWKHFALSTTFVFDGMLQLARVGVSRLLNIVWGKLIKMKMRIR
jgi:hypothetical protein